MTTLSQAAEQMLAAGMPGFPGRLADRRRADPSLRQKKRAWYRLRELPRRAGGTFIAGISGSGASSTGRRSSPTSPASMTRSASGCARPGRRARRNPSARSARKALHAAGAPALNGSAARAELPAGVRCPYLERKGIAHENGAFRYLVDGELATLVVPMVRYDVKADPQDEASRRRGAPSACRRSSRTGPSDLTRGRPSRRVVPARQASERRRADPVRRGRRDGRIDPHGDGARYPVVVCFTPAISRGRAHLSRALSEIAVPVCADDDAYLDAQLNARLRGDFDARRRPVRPRANMRPAPPEICWPTSRLVEDERGVQASPASSSSRRSALSDRLRECRPDKGERGAARGRECLGLLSAL
jgi:hypothetical protein